MPLQGSAPYEVSKSCADLIAQTYYTTYDLPVAIARCGNIYGGGDLNWSRIIPYTIWACLMNTELEIRSDGTFLRDYIYVKDVVNAYLMLAELLDNASVRGQAFNFSPDRVKSVLEIVEAVQTLMQCQQIQPVIRNAVRDEIHDQYLDSSKAQRILNWECSYSLEAGLQETISWYRQYLAPRDIS